MPAASRYAGGVRTSTWIVLAAVAMAAALLLWSRTRDVDAPASAPPPPAAASRTDVTAAATPAAAPRVVREARVDPMSAYLDAASLRRFVDQYLPRALGGDGEAAFAVFLALNECDGVVSEEPLAGILDDPRSHPEVAARRAAYENRFTRCDGVQYVPNAGKLPRELVDAGVRAGYAPALAVDLATADARDAQVAARARDLMPRVDGLGIASFSNYVFNRNNGPALGNPPVTYDQTVYAAAWTLAACDLGLDCSRTSRLLERMCIYENRCGLENYRAYLSVSVPPDRVAAASDLHERILAALRTGDAAFFGIAPAR